MIRDSDSNRKGTYTVDIQLETCEVREFKSLSRRMEEVKQNVLMSVVCVVSSETMISLGLACSRMSMIQNKHISSYLEVTE